MPSQKRQQGGSDPPASPPPPPARRTSVTSDGYLDVNSEDEPGGFDGTWDPDATYEVPVSDVTGESTSPSQVVGQLND